MTTKHSFSVIGCVTALVLAVMASSVSAETLLMPKRDFQKTATSEVVWGITTLPNGTSTYTINFGDGSVVGAPVAVVDRSYIAVNHAFLCGAAICPYTITLTVTPLLGLPEVATTTVNVLDQAGISAEDLRNLNINRAIQDGLRFLWTTQSNRMNFDTTSTTWWGSGGKPQGFG